MRQGPCETRRRQCAAQGSNRHHQYRNSAPPTAARIDPANMQWLCYACHHELGHNRFNQTQTPKWPDVTNGLDGDGLTAPLVF